MLQRTDRAIWRLAFPAFLTLVAEPLFLLADAAVVGHLGTTELAGLGVAAVVLQTVVGLCVFLAYGTTASVARRLGAGDLRAALTQGVDGVWLAAAIGVVATGVGLALSGPLVAAFGVDDDVADAARTYLRIALLGVTPLLVMLATTGVLRGLQDTRTPLAVAVGGNALNVALNVVLVFGVGGLAGLGIAGSALGSVLAQVASAAVLTGVVVRAARREGVRLTPDGAGIRAAGRAGVPLLVRTITLRAALLVTALSVAGHGSTDEVATHQLAMTLWAFLAFALDAVAIAAQALVGRGLGTGDLDDVRALTRRMIGWGWVSGVATGLLLAASAPFVGALFSPDPAVQDLLVPVLLVAALGQPVAGVVFVLDGVLIGAGDGRYLALAGAVVLVAYAPVALVVGATTGGLVGVWVVYVLVFMGGRYVTLTRRARGGRWLATPTTLAP